MQRRLARSKVIRFQSVVLKARHDGWTPQRQIRFIAELAATRSVTRACKAVGMSREAAYKLRAHDCRRQYEHETRDRSDACPEPGRGAAPGFAAAWRAALEPDSPPSAAARRARFSGCASSRRPGCSARPWRAPKLTK